MVLFVSSSADEYAAPQSAESAAVACARVGRPAPALAACSALPPSATRALKPSISLRPSGNMARLARAPAARRRSASSVESSAKCAESAATPCAASTSRAPAARAQIFASALAAARRVALSSFPSLRSSRSSTAASAPPARGAPTAASEPNCAASERYASARGGWWELGEYAKYLLDEEVVTREPSDIFTAPAAPAGGYA